VLSPDVGAPSEAAEIGTTQVILLATNQSPAPNSSTLPGLPGLMNVDFLPMFCGLGQRPYSLWQSGPGPNSSWFRYRRIDGLLGNSAPAYGNCRGSCGYLSFGPRREVWWPIWRVCCVCRRCVYFPSLVRAMVSGVDVNDLERSWSLLAMV
jgi:hypothetical protein